MKKPIFIVVLMLVGFARADEPTSLTLESAIREALAANPTLRAEFATVQAARLVGVQRGALPDPKLSYTEFLSSVETRTGPQERAVSLTQAAPWPGKLKLARQIADSRAREAAMKYEAKRLETVEATGELFFEYAYLAVAERVAERNRALLEQLKPVVKQQVRGGENLAASLRLEIEIARIEDRLQTLVQKRPALSARLTRMLGRDPSPKPIPFPDFPKKPPAFENVESLAARIGEHPLVKATREGVIASEQAAELAAKAGKPDVNLGLNVIDIGNGGDTAVGATLGFSLPFSRKKYQAERDEALHRADAARAMADDIRLTLTTQLYVAIQVGIENENRLRLYDEKLIPASQQAVELTGEAFRNNKATLTDMIDTERTLLELELERAEALKNAHLAALAVRVLVEPELKPETEK